MRAELREAKRWVVKIGSAMVTNDGQGLDHQAIALWAAQIATLRAQGKQVVLVSSGAVAEGIKRLGWSERPHQLNQLQAAAAVGQMGLVQAYESGFQDHDIHTAQVLLTHDDLSDRRRYLNARSTLRALLDMGIVPVVNENDTVAIDEIAFGDNDTLAALVANLIEADALVILTDQQGLFNADPRSNPDAQLLHEVQANDRSLEAMASSKGGSLGRGGMYTKVKAAQRAARSGASTLIAYGRETNVLGRLADGEVLGTRFSADQQVLDARKQWLASQLKVKGVLHLDEGASRRLSQTGVSLLSVGVTKVDGDFTRGELVSLFDADGKELARGLVNYSARESVQICGHASSEIEAILGYVDEDELVHRDNLIFL